MHDTLSIHMGDSRLLIILPLNADKCPALRTMLRMSGSLKSLYCAFCDRVMTNNSHAIAVTPLLFAVLCRLLPLHCSLRSSLSQ
jgi:hypothetical protein